MFYEKLSGVRVEDNIFYRIGVINDFQASFSFIEYRNFGVIKSWSSGKFSEPHKGYNDRDDRIHVFLNYEKVGAYKSKEEANLKIRELLNKHEKDLFELKEYVLV